MAARLLVSFLLLALNAFFLHHPALGGVSLVLWLASVSGALGVRAAPSSSPVASRIIGGLVALALLALGGTIIYYVMPVTTAGLLLVAAIVSVIAFVSAQNRQPAALPKLKIDRTDVVLFVLGGVGIAAWWSAIIPIDIDEAVRSPWTVVPTISVLALAMSGAAAALAAHRGSRGVATTLLCAILFAVLSLASVVYEHGYGFDPFLHRATVEHIVEHGTITPKPLYYIGQYALELAGVRLFALPLVPLDELLAPTLLALVVAGATLASPQSRMQALAFIFLPLAGFIPTTPQALGYVWALAAVFAMLRRDDDRPSGAWLPWLFGITALATHPIAGIPTCLFLATAELWRRKQRALTVTLTVVGALALPAVFLLQAAIFGLDAAWSPSFDLAQLPVTGFFGTGFDAWMDALYLVFANMLWITIALALIGSWRAKLSASEQALWLTTGMLAVNFVVLALGIDFSFLISYEQSDFAARLLVLIPLFLVPLVAKALERIGDRVTRQSVGAIFVAMGIVALITAANAYGAYPRHDGYARSAGFNVTQHDIDTVHAIDRREGDVDYVVLANQAVSAAAVQAFGFRKYYQGDVFYYPIPTGGPLYDIYLDMVDDAATRENAQQAMDLAGVNTAYLVVNDYWWQSDRVVEQAKREADDWFALGDGAVTVFVFTRQE